MTSATRQAIEAVRRIESGRLVAGLARVVRDVGLAEDLRIASAKKAPTAAGVPFEVPTGARRVRPRRRAHGERGRARAPARQGRQRQTVAPAIRCSLVPVGRG